MFAKLKPSVMSAGSLVVSQLILQVAGPLISIFVVRYLGPDDYGYYASAMAVTALIGILADFGIIQATMKHGSKGDRDLSTAFRMGRKISFSLASLAYVITLVWFLALNYKPVIIQIGLLLGINYFVMAYRAPAIAVLQTQGAYKKLAAISVGVSISQWITTIIMLLMHADVRLIAGVPVLVAGLVSLMSFFWATRHLASISKSSSKSEIRQFLHDVWVFGLSGTFHLIYYQSDGALLSAMRSSLEVGFYNIPFRFLGIIYAAPGLLFQVLYPKYFKLSSTDRERYRLLYILTSKLMLILGVVISLGLWTFGELAIDIVFGKDFGPSYKYLVILAGAVTFRCWATATGAVLSTDNLAERKVRLQGEIALLNLVLNLIFIPIYGALAAAITTVLSDVLLSLRYFQSVNKDSLRISPWRDLKIHYFLGALLAGITIELAPGLAEFRIFAFILLIALLLIYVAKSLYFGEEEIAELFVRVRN